MFWSFLGGPKLPNFYYRYSQIAVEITFFDATRKICEKRDLRVYLAQNPITFLRPSFISIFQEIYET